MDWIGKEIEKLKKFRVHPAYFYKEYGSNIFRK